MNGETHSNQGYAIIESCTIGNTELVIGHHPKAPNPYVCWYCTKAATTITGAVTATPLKLQRKSSMNATSAGVSDAVQSAAR